MKGQIFYPQQALQKIKQYCAYQERCRSEVNEKLYSFGLCQKDVEGCISNLIEENYLNEERFAIQFAGGRFRIKNWGRIKIKYALKQKKVSDLHIKKALGAIDDACYIQTLCKLAKEKIKTLRNEKNIFVRKKKLQDYLLMKGYESDLVKEEIRNIFAKLTNRGKTESDND